MDQVAGVERQPGGVVVPVLAGGHQPGAGGKILQGQSVAAPEGGRDGRILKQQILPGHIGRAGAVGDGVLGVALKLRIGGRVGQVAQQGAGDHRLWVGVPVAAIVDAGLGRLLLQQCGDHVIGPGLVGGGRSPAGILVGQVGGQDVLDRQCPVVPSLSPESALLGGDAVGGGEQGKDKLIVIRLGGGLEGRCVGRVAVGQGDGRGHQERVLAGPVVGTGVLIGIHPAFRVGGNVVGPPPDQVDRQPALEEEKSE